MNIFEPTLQAAQASLAAVQPAAYARTRNALEGAVTRLSPYLTHGLLSLRQVFDAVHARHPLDPQHKFVFELGWRAYYRHVWGHLGDGIHQSIHAGLLPDAAYQASMPADVLEARTGIAAIDRAVHELYATGYVHNHARMWLASYLVHLRKVHWHAGAQWMLGHLLDGDLASNHLSWQWVAGTSSTKPYVFNADNVAKYAPAPWHSPGTVVDTTYEALDRMARSAEPVSAGDDGKGKGDLTWAGMAPPAVYTAPQDAGWSAPDGAQVAGRDVWLLHPWALGAPAPTADAVVVGLGIAEAHAAMPWSARRWHFVTQGLRARTETLWWGSTAAIGQALRAARTVHWQPDPHLPATLLGVPAHPHMPPDLFEPVETYCQSFAQWWRRTRIAD